MIRAEILEAILAAHADRNDDQFYGAIRQLVDSVGWIDAQAMREVVARFGYRVPRDEPQPTLDDILLLPDTRRRLDAIVREHGCADRIREAGIALT